MKDCIFCQIIAKKLPAKIVYADDLVVAFHDIHPRADVHLLVVPKKHIVDLRQATRKDEPSLGRMMMTAKTLAERLGFKQKGYQLLMSNGKDAGQEVMHAHLHVLSGKSVGFLK